MNPWCLMSVITAFGLGAFIAGWQLIQAQERVNQQKEEELRRCKSEKEELEIQLNDSTAKLQSLEEENSALKEKIENLEKLVEEKEMEIASLKRMLNEKGGIKHKSRHRRPRILD
ncbi:chemotaxis protein MotB [Thermosulfidibacter takaii ABI70S6]|uniref:Chemotaxis protein MotB n=1 Tax=Thermosulfidibacter takaii (strain DSM 17441 / JCM 13301 / NBRC 103674 / ABI70S6) TaxID=1298851 RepID=A0A0S3QUD3_THET7|nr:hypothetical protein [Thermosulfidibacter takaii]BAT71916.1 chemotaxis protein MotB [Thermosulfidibacter takaii ABI70S6]